MAAVIRSRGGDIQLGHRVEAIEEGAACVNIGSVASSFESERVIVCAGLMADRLAALSGLASDFRIVPFRGEYYRLPPHLNDLVRHLIYPIPNPELPFLGVHLTRTIDGGILAGPNAVLSLAREGYRKGAIDLSDMLELLRFRGLLSPHARSSAHRLGRAVELLVTSGLRQAVPQILPAAARCRSAAPPERRTRSGGDARRHADARLSDPSHRAHAARV